MISPRREMSELQAEILMKARTWRSEIKSHQGGVGEKPWRSMLQLKAEISRQVPVWKQEIKNSYKHADGEAIKVLFRAIAKLLKTASRQPNYNPEAS